MGDVTVPCIRRSPFPSRQDKKPSFSLYGSKTSPKWKDFAYKTGDVFTFVMEMFNIGFREALYKINADLGLNLIQHKYSGIVTKPVKENPIINYSDTPIKVSIVQRDISKIDYTYWSKRIEHNVNRRLQRNRCFPTNMMLVNGNTFWTHSEDNPLYSYVYYTNNSYYYKCYRPLTDDGRKFYNDMKGVSDKCIHGIWYLPKEGDYVIITKSGKDAMVLDALGFVVIAIQGESQQFHPKLIQYLKKKFKRIYLLYDNDYNKKENWGQNFAKARVEQYPELINIVIPTEYESVDTDDLVINTGFKHSKNILWKLLEMY